MSKTESETRVPSVSVVKLVVGVALGVLVAAAVIFAVYQASQPRDCALQRLEATTGDRLPSDVDEGCR